MAKTDALISVDDVVSRFLLKYKKTTDDAFIYLEHACNCIRDFCLYDSNQLVTAKVSINANKWIEMPSDMVGFVDLCVPTGGEWWSFTEKRTIVNTTTFTGLVEGLDEDFGEGVGVTSPQTTGYGAKGGINAYNYTIDWSARRIFISGMDSATVALLYTTSGIEASGTTAIPEFITPLIDSYLLWKSSYWETSRLREREMLERDYTKTRLTIRNFINSMSYSEWKDIILSGVTQGLKR